MKRQTFHKPKQPPMPPIGSAPPRSTEKVAAARTRRPVVVPIGPRLYRTTRAQELSLSGPGPAPAGFVTAQQTATEWVWYWASMKVLDPERDPRKPPFWGGQNWAYQSQQLAQIPGVHTKAMSTNIDFLYMLSFPYIAVRIQTYRYHTGATSIKQAYDRAQQVREVGQFNEVDVYEQDFLSDSSGATAIILLKETLGLIRRINPDTVGNTVQVHNPFASLGKA